MVALHFRRIFPVWCLDACALVVRVRDLRCALCRSVQFREGLNLVVDGCAVWQVLIPCPMAQAAIAQAFNTIHVGKLHISPRSSSRRCGCLQSASPAVVVADALRCLDAFTRGCWHCSARLLCSCACTDVLRQVLRLVSLLAADACLQARTLLLGVRARALVHVEVLR